MKVIDLKYERTIDEGALSEELESLFIKLSDVTDKEIVKIESISTNYLSKIYMTRRNIAKRDVKGRVNIFEEKYHGLQHTAFGSSESCYAVFERIAEDNSLSLYLELPFGKNRKLFKDLMSKFNPELKAEKEENQEGLEEVCRELLTL